MQQQRPVSLSERMKIELNGGSDSEGSSTPRGQRKMMETWIVLELCNRGSLQVCHPSPLSLQESTKASLGSKWVEIIQLLSFESLREMDTLMEDNALPAHQVL